MVSCSELEGLLEGSEASRGCPFWQLSTESHDCWCLLVHADRQLHPDITLPVPLDCICRQLVSAHAGDWKVFWSEVRPAYIVFSGSPARKSMIAGVS